MTAQSSMTIPGPVGLLQVCIETGSKAGVLATGNYCVVICHPHPLYGGTMDSQVVISIARVYRDLGVTVARFNFRGVGASEGAHDEGVGEVGDLRAVAQHLLCQRVNSRLLIAGYSFGAAIVAAGDASLKASHIALIAPPTENYPFAPRGYFSCPAVVILGAKDDLARAHSASKWAKQLSSRIDVITLAETDHFFTGQLAALASALAPVLIDALM